MLTMQREIEKIGKALGGTAVFFDLNDCGGKVAVSKPLSKETLEHLKLHAENYTHGVRFPSGKTYVYSF